MHTRGRANCSTAGTAEGVSGRAGHLPGDLNAPCARSVLTLVSKSTRSLRGQHVRPPDEGPSLLSGPRFWGEASVAGPSLGRWEFLRIPTSD